MGRPKAFIEVDGRSLLDLAVAALTDAAVDPIVVVGGDQGAIEAAGHRFVPDEYPGEGPLGGIISALGAVDTDLVVVLSCDLLAASPVAVSRLIASIGEGDVVVPVVEGRAQWLHAAWRRSAESALRTAFGRGERSPRRALDGLVTVEVSDTSARWYQDADTPSDLPPGAR